MDESTSNPNDYLLLSPEKLADSVGICRAFVQLAIDAGCPMQDGMLNREMLFRWLHEHSGKVRKIAGLPDVPPVSDCSICKASELLESRAILTMLDFMYSRACTPETRSFCEELATQVIEAE